MAEAPPVTISTRSTRAGGIEPRSTAALPGSPATWRWPSTRTSVRLEPRLRRSAKLSPPALPKLLELPRMLLFTPMLGSWPMMSPKSATPEFWINWVVSAWTGVGWSRFGLGMCEPVTISSPTWVDPPAAAAVCAIAPPRTGDGDQHCPCKQGRSAKRHDQPLRGPSPTEPTSGVKARTGSATCELTAPAVVAPRSGCDGILMLARLLQFARRGCVRAWQMSNRCASGSRALPFIPGRPALPPARPGSTAGRPGPRSSPPASVRRRW